MKYFKLIRSGGGYDDPNNTDYTFEVGKIYPGNFSGAGLSVAYYAEKGTIYWQQVTEEEYEIQEGLRLPKAWYIKVTEENKNIIDKWLGHSSAQIGNIAGICYYAKNDRATKGHNPSTIITSDTNGYTFGTEISFETFKKLVLKQDNMEQKEIIGWKLKDDKYKQFVKNLTNAKEFNFKDFETQAHLYTIAVGEMKEAGVLELWFEPVYIDKYKVGDWITFTNLPNEYAKHNGDIVKITNISQDQHETWYNHEPYSFSGGGFSYKAYKNCFRKATEEEIKKATTLNITIKGYKAEFYDNGVKFGCQEYDKNFIIKLNNCLQKNDFKMDYKDEIKKMAEYFQK